MLLSRSFCLTEKATCLIGSFNNGNIIAAIMIPQAGSPSETAVKIRVERSASLRKADPVSIGVESVAVHRIRFPEWLSFSVVTKGLIRSKIQIAALKSQIHHSGKRMDNTWILLR
ncbi:hypothetical protein D3C80_1525930 [compost metagenome]